MNTQVTAVADLKDPVERLMGWPVATVDVTTSLVEAAVALADNDIGAVAVNAGDRFVGVLSERDLAVRVAGDGIADAVVEDVVTYDPVTVARTETVMDAARAMVDAGIRHLPVVEDGEVVGMLSLRDVTAVLLASVP